MAATLFTTSRGTPRPTPSSAHPPLAPAPFVPSPPLCPYLGSPVRRTARHHTRPSTPTAAGPHHRSRAPLPSSALTPETRTPHVTATPPAPPSGVELTQLPDRFPLLGYLYTNFEKTYNCTPGVEFAKANPMIPIVLVSVYMVSRAPPPGTPHPMPAHTPSAVPPRPSPIQARSIS